MKRSSIIFLFVLTLLFNTVLLFAYHTQYQKDSAINHLFTHNSYTPTKSQRAHDNDELNANRHNAITDAVSMIENAVVSVNVMKRQYVRSNPFFDDAFFDFFGGIREREVQSIGSGVIFSEDGYLLTNAHVVDGATKIKVVLPDGRETDAKLIGIDTVHDIAVVKCNEKSLPMAKLGKSDDLIIGEWVIAAGNPYGYLMKDSKPSVSVGVISAINRNFVQKADGKVYKGMIQTDTAINPGNSGGPLVNINGEVIGINSFILSESGGSVGIGFAIPIDRVKKIAEELIKYGQIREAYFGFKVQDLSRMIVSYLNLDSMDGVIVSTIDKNGPAQKAGMIKGDVITSINGIIIKDTNDAELAVSDIAPAEKVNITIIRNNKNLSLQLISGEYR
ncbi:MAG: trypsin-like peptidase domain-containing protein [Candidatus Cloacimonadales bacterium]|jgi:serine protease Do|nr:trypsin-like peptidase domain-containing protein [Candidatus Cloacimonadota bacterium]MDD2650079.1 trypsin-like peptidase domain-containing protein [Candidatus Cloacimonadota bacterium]MDX9976748.1 trypsin-like peptidase domain-containing protein [Candidatus Cloacimonadales bacterium]